MSVLGLVDAARLTSLASGRGGLPTAEEWPWVAGLLLLFAIVGTRLLIAVGLTRIEAILVAGLSPLLVLIDAPLGELDASVALAANATGCLIPAAVSVKILFERRLPWAEALVLVSLGTAVAFMSSHVVPSRGVLLQYRVPALVLGVLAAALLYRQPDRAGAGAFAAGALGVVIGADLMRLGELTSAGANGRIILGGAGLLDGILLVAVLGAAVGEGTAMILRAVMRLKIGQRTAA